MVRLFRIFISIRVLLLLVSEIVWTVGAFVLASWLTLGVDPTVFLWYEGGLFRVFLVTAGIVVTLYLQDLYTQIAVRSRILLGQQLLQAAGVGFLTEALGSYVFRDLRLPASMMFLGSGIWLAGLYIWRLSFGSLMRQLVGVETMLLAGVSPAAREMASRIAARPELGVRVTGYLNESAIAGAAELGPYLGPVDALREVAEQTRPSRLVVGLADMRRRLPLADLIDLRVEGFRIEEAAATFESVCMRVSLDLLRPSDLVFPERLSPPRRSALVHAALDIGVAAIAVTLFLPLGLVVAAAVKLGSPGPVFYRQRRIGLHGRPFDMLKFRTMDDTPEGPQATPAGRWLRTLRLNELPQFLNVLTRDMSIVGPRPERPDYVATFNKEIPFYGQRHAVRPGITGWAQINYGHGDSVEDTRRKLEHDLYYIKHMSESLDLFIMFHTAKAVLLARDAG